MADRVLAHRSITVLWNTSVTSFEGAGGVLTHARVRTQAPAADGSGALRDAETLLEVSAAFVSIGHDPNTALFEGQLALGTGGYLEPRASEAVTLCGPGGNLPYLRLHNPLLRPLQARAVTST